MKRRAVTGCPDEEREGIVEKERLREGMTRAGRMSNTEVVHS